MVDVILGLQWGDEGKGKIVDLLAEHLYTAKVCGEDDYSFLGVLPPESAQGGDQLLDLRLRLGWELAQQITNAIAFFRQGKFDRRDRCFF